TPSSTRSFDEGPVLGQHDLVRVHVGHGLVPGQRGNMTIQVEVVRNAEMAIIGDPRLDDAGAKPDVVVILARVPAGGESERMGVALREGDELRRSYLANEAQPRPLSVAARLVAEQRVHQVTGAVLDAIHRSAGIDKG